MHLSDAGYAHLLPRLDLGRFEVRNRIVMGSMHVGLEDSPADAPGLAAELDAERATRQAVEIAAAL